MKKLLERLRPDSDRKKLIASACAVGLVLIAAMLLPLAFRTAPDASPPPAELTQAERMRMFADYWTLGAEASGFTVTKPETVPHRMRETCETVMHTLIARSIDDRGLSDPTPTGSEYTYVSDGAGREIAVCRMWLEARGEWQNWMDVCMDAETGALYYFYLSRECLTNRRNYSVPDNAGCEQIAETLAAENGWTLRHLAEAGDGAALAVYAADGGTLCWQISSRVYDALIDVKVSCR